MATTLTVITATDQTAQQNFNGARERFMGQTAGFQHLGTIQLSTGAGRQDLIYDPTGDIIYAVAIS